MVRKAGAILILLVVAVLFYCMSMCKMAVYNNSGAPISKLSVESKWINKHWLNFEDQQVLHLSVFAPFNRKVKIMVENPNQIRSVSFELHNSFYGEQYNQVEISFGAEIKVGELGR